VQVVADQELPPERLAALQAEASSKGLGSLYVALGGGRRGLEACAAIEKLVEVSTIDKLLSAFILPLQQDDIATGSEGAGYRVHCSLNLNTETGRLSARRPNLQNQPAQEKDRYKVCWGGRGGWVYIGGREDPGRRAGKEGRQWGDRGQDERQGGGMRGRQQSGSSH
jgi:hypothetical protein